MSNSNIRICCPAMETMINDQTIAISNMSNLPWIKILQHNGTEEIGENPVRFNYNNIRFCPFCGSEIGLNR